MVAKEEPWRTSAKGKHNRNSIDEPPSSGLDSESCDELLGEPVIPIRFAIQGVTADEVLGEGHRTLDLVKMRMGCTTIDMQSWTKDANQEMVAGAQDMAVGKKVRNTTQRLAKAHKKGDRCGHIETLLLKHADG